MEKKIIKENTTVFQALTDHPELKDVLLEISPKYKKLQNPVMFNSIAKVTPFKAAAKVGGVYIHEMLLRLNEAIGLKDEYLKYHKSRIPEMQKEFLSRQFVSGASENEKPGWMERSGGFEITDVRMKGEPFQLITSKAERLKAGEGFGMKQGFRPQPLIDFLEGRGFESYVEKISEEEFDIYFYRKEDK